MINRHSKCSTPIALNEVPRYIQQRYHKLISITLVVYKPVTKYGKHTGQTYTLRKKLWGWMIKPRRPNTDTSIETHKP